MQKMIKIYLRFYEVFKNAIENNLQFVEIVHCKVKMKVNIEARTKLFLEAVNNLEASLTDKEVRKVLIMSYFKRQHDKIVLSKIHMSQAAFYRVKNKIVNKLLLLCVENGLISKEEIINLKIN